jgi:hypothetical protein
MKIVFVGESWLGSCARSLREALARHPDVMLDEINEEALMPKHRARWLRGVHRMLAAQYRRELGDALVARVQRMQPDVVMAYKGNPVDAPTLARVKQICPQAFTVNVYPDYSPHAYGCRHRRAVGAYDLVISTKPFHPDIWGATYGYTNQCCFVPQGYDPCLHLVPRPPSVAEYDVGMVATWRPEYHRLMVGLARELQDLPMRVGIGGNGWIAHAGDFPAHWNFPGELTGRSYIHFLRSAKICIAPVNREVQIDGHAHPGDEDTTRSYELAAAHCFFLHQRTPYIQRVYDESIEVPMFEDAKELAAHVRHFLARSDVRLHFSAGAHARAVPAYSMDARVADIVRILRARSNNFRVPDGS